MSIYPSPHFPYSGRRLVEPVSGAAALEAQTVTVGYEGVGEAVLHGVTLLVAAGTRVALVGPNGAGKSTLLKATAGLLPLRSGRILIYGQPVGACHHRTAYLPQRGEVDWRFPITLRRLVLTGRYVHLGWLKRPSSQDWQMTDEAIEQMGLTELAERQISHLSGGQQQRALLARALAQDADLLLLDEPLNAIDNDTRAKVVEVLARLQKQGKTAVVATHDLGRLETDFDGALYLSDGRLVPAPPGSFSNQ